MRSTAAFAFSATADTEIFLFDSNGNLALTYEGLDRPQAVTREAMVAKVKGFIVADPPAWAIREMAARLMSRHRAARADARQRTRARPRLPLCRRATPGIRTHRRRSAR